MGDIRGMQGGGFGANAMRTRNAVVQLPWGRYTRRSRRRRGEYSVNRFRLGVDVLVAIGSIRTLPFGRQLSSASIGLLSLFRRVSGY